MNKNLLAMTALAAMLFAGCTSSDDLTTRETITKANEAATPINFGTYMGKTGTRAGATGEILTPASGAQNELGTNTYEFGVFAYLSNGGADGSTLLDPTNITIKPNFMYNEKVSTSDHGENWTYSPVKYWPNGIDASNTANNPSNIAVQSTVQYLSFFAYAPYVSSFSGENGMTALTPASNAAGAPVISYTLKSGDYTVENNVDLLWGTRGAATYNETDGANNDATPLPTTPGPYAYNINLTKQNTTDKVNFLFKHALAKIGGVNGLKVKLDVDNNEGGAIDANSCVTISDITISNVANEIATTGTFNIATGTWTASKNSSIAAGNIVQLNTAEKINENFFSTTGATYSGSWSPSGVTSDPTTVYKAGLTDKGFYLFPGVAEQKIKISITYTVSTVDSKLDGGYSRVTQTINNEVTLPTLVSNQYYTLIMHLGLTSVKFSATVDNWDTTTGTVTKEVWLPSNVVPAVTP